jgi:CRP-like cAMP-binding protein
MSQTDLFKELQSSDFFSGVADEYLQSLSEICELQEFPGRSTVFEEYERAGKVYIIFSGEI